MERFSVRFNDKIIAILLVLENTLELEKKITGQPKTQIENLECS